MLPPSLGNRHCKVMVGLGLPAIILPPYKKYLSESEAKKRCPELRGTYGEDWALPEDTFRIKSIQRVGEFIHIPVSLLIKPALGLNSSG